MFTQKREKLTPNTTPEKPPYHKSFVQVEGELTKTQLEAIAGGSTGGGWGGNHNEILVIPFLKSNRRDKKLIKSK